MERKAPKDKSKANKEGRDRGREGGMEGGMGSLVFPLKIGEKTSDSREIKAGRGLSPRGDRAEESSQDGLRLRGSTLARRRA